MEAELSHGCELARRLEAKVSSGPVELRPLVQELILCLEKARSRAKSAEGGANSPPCFAEDGRKGMTPKKRRAQSVRANQVKLGTGPEAEGPVDDGYSWRKYGQKDILGAKNPRGYFRCTHSKTQGCLAMKKVQKSDSNPLIYEVTYLGTHTCLQKSPPTDRDHRSDQQLLLGFQANLKVETENLDSKFQDPTSSFSFPNTPLDSYFEGGFSSAFISPATSESNYLSASPCGMSGYAGGPGIQASESDFAEIMSSMDPKLDDDLAIGFAANFEFDPSNFFL